MNEFDPIAEKVITNFVVLANVEVWVPPRKTEKNVLDKEARKLTMVQVQSSIYITCSKLNINPVLRGMLISDNEAKEPKEDGGGSW